MTTPEGEGWMTEEFGHRPTGEDMIKYASQKSTLLLQIDFLVHPVELQIEDVAEGGKLFKTKHGWLETRTAKVLHLFPPPDMPKPMPQPPMTDHRDLQSRLKQLYANTKKETDAKPRSRKGKTRKPSPRKRPPNKPGTPPAE